MSETAAPRSAAWRRRAPGGGAPPGRGARGVRVLVLFAHPLETSFVAALHRRVVETLRGGGHEVDDLDLYAEEFNPVMSRQTLVDYLDAAKNRAEVAAYVERLRAAEALVLVYPRVVRQPSRHAARLLRARLPARRQFQDRRSRALSPHPVERQAARRGVHLRRGAAADLAQGRSGAPLRAITTSAG